MVLAGTFSATKSYNAIPVFAPAYRPAPFPSHFTDIDCILIKYRTDGPRVRSLIPDNLTIEDEPLITTHLVSYGCSPIGPYHEYMHSIEVSYQGTKFEYPILILLDNEDAAYSGRELWGAPKVLGSFEFPRRPDGTSGFMRGRICRPTDFPVVDILFKPSGLLPLEDFVEPANNSLFLRVLPSVVPHKTPHVRQFMEVDFKITHRQIWEGVGSIRFPAESAFDPFHLTPVKEYVSAHMSRGSSATIAPVDVHDF
ncbi:acetoacetate decarboxylase-like protein [Corynespora cassiicola Philippines]|uniref:Acetoacetate decarboxylase-like protein n=1 Tax=Corynespora cassiicola Philippines TaxID=1448308 RepID=A0A2T2P4R3_CORCC|nr:acetoacetate decarboxylase-like protein [Corynespora cassiicola Philippines]